MNGRKMWEGELGAFWAWAEGKRPLIRRDKDGKGFLKGFLAFALRIHTCSQNLEDKEGK